MKVRMGLLNEDIADQFKGSRTLISQVFSTWVREKAKVLSCMIKVLDLDIVNILKPKKSNYKNYILLQLPLKYSFRHQKITYLTWSHYKHHNTLKVLLNIAPSSDIVFISLTYPGSISDKEITKQSGYLGMMETYAELMICKGFNIINSFMTEAVII